MSTSGKWGREEKILYDDGEGDSGDTADNGDNGDVTDDSDSDSREAADNSDNGNVSDNGDVTSEVVLMMVIMTVEKLLITGMRMKELWCVQLPSLVNARNFSLTVCMHSDIL